MIIISLHMSVQADSLHFFSSFLDKNRSLPAFSILLLASRSLSFSSSPSHFRQSSFFLRSFSSFSFLLPSNCRSL